MKGRMDRNKNKMKPTMETNGKDEKVKRMKSRMENDERGTTGKRKKNDGGKERT